MLLRGDERVRVSLAVEVTIAAERHRRAARRPQVRRSLDSRRLAQRAPRRQAPADGRANGPAPRGQPRPRGRPSALRGARSPPPPADGSGVRREDAIAKEASASLAEMFLRVAPTASRARGQAVTGGAAAAAVPEAAAAAAAAAAADARQMCNDAANFFLREWERSDPHEAKAGVGAALRTLLAVRVPRDAPGDRRRRHAHARGARQTGLPAAQPGGGKGALRRLPRPRRPCVRAAPRAPFVLEGRCACSTPTTDCSRPPPTAPRLRRCASAPRR